MSALAFQFPTAPLRLSGATIWLTGIHLWTRRMAARIARRFAL